jgi:hypothetical protein
MARRNRTLLERLRLHLAGARHLSLSPRTEGVKRFQPGDVDERPWRGSDTLILRAGIVQLEARYIVRAPDSGRVLKAWTQPFKPSLRAVETLQLARLFAVMGIGDEPTAM